MKRFVPRGALLTLAGLVVGLGWSSLDRSPTESPPVKAKELARSPAAAPQPVASATVREVTPDSFVPVHHPALWRMKGPITGKPVVLDLQKGIGRSAKLDAQSAPSFRSMKPGDTLQLPIPGKGVVEATVNYSQLDPGSGADALWFIAGALADDLGGYWLSQSGAGWMAGYVLFNHSPTAWQIAASGSGTELIIQEVATSSILCTDASASLGSQTATQGPGGGPTVPQPKVSSRPNAQACIFLDFEGGVMQQAMWNIGVPFTVKAPSLSEAAMIEIWRHVKDDYAPFDVNVTTDRTVYTATPPGRRMRCMIAAETIFTGGGPAGIAYLGSFKGAGGYSALREIMYRRTGTDYNKPTSLDLSQPQPTVLPIPFPSETVCWVFANQFGSPQFPRMANSVLVANAISHEVGHTLNLLHDSYGGTEPAQNYYSGHGANKDHWTALMGDIGRTGFAQWSKGEFEYAFNAPLDALQDDLAVIAANVAVAPSTGFVPDDHGSTIQAATPLFPLSTGTFYETGILGVGEDRDVFRLVTANSGTIELAADTDFISNADLRIDLLDSSGALITTDATLNQRYGQIIMPNLPAGTYFIVVRGNAQGDPTGIGNDPGWSNYGNVGEYRLRGFAYGNIPPPEIAESVPVTGVVGIPYTHPLQSTPSAQSWQVVQGSLPPGLLLSGNAVTGTPTTVGSYEAVILATRDGVSSVRSFTFPIVSQYLVPEAVEATDLPWVFGSFPSGANWTGQPLVSFDGIDAARSGSIGTNAESWMEVSVPGPAVVTFRARVSAATGDQLEVKLGSTVLHTRTGDSSWESFSVTIPSGTHTLRWTYKTDAGGTAGDNAAYVDEVVYTRAPDIQNYRYATGRVGVPFVQDLIAKYPVSSWVIDTGSPPPGLTFNAVQRQVTGTPTTPGTFSITYQASNAGGSDLFEITYFISPNLDLAQALDAPTLPWNTAGTNPWQPVTSPTHDGADAARTGPISHRGQSLLITNITGPGTLSFQMRTDSEPTHDKLRFFIDDTQQAELSGNTSWAPYTFNLPAGPHNLRWEYTKDGSGNSGADAGWVDEVTWTGQPPVGQGPIPQFVGPQTISGFIGTPLSAQLQFNHAPTSFGYDSMPSGLTLNTTTGQITGTPIGTAITTQSTFNALNSAGSGSGVVQFIIEAPPGLPSQITPLYANGIYGQPFYAKLKATHGGGNWQAFANSYRSGNLPQGLTLNPITGEITGTPSQYPGSALTGWQFSNSVGSGLGETFFQILLPSENTYEAYGIAYRLGDGNTSTDNISLYQNADKDGDGMTNHQEFIARTDPNDRESRFHIVQSDYGTQDYAVRLIWQAYPGVVYEAQASPDLQSWEPLVTVSPEGTLGSATHTATGTTENVEFFYPLRSSAAPHVFFRLRVVP